MTTDWVFEKKKVHNRDSLILVNRSNCFLGHSSDSNESRVNDNGMLVFKDEFSSELMTSTQQLHPSVRWLFITFIFLHLISSTPWSIWLVVFKTGIREEDASTDVTSRRKQSPSRHVVAVINCFRCKLQQFKKLDVSNRTLWTRQTVK